MKKITLLLMLLLAVFSAKGISPDPLMVTDYDVTNFSPTFWYSASPQFCTIATIVDPDNASNHILQFNRTTTASAWHGPQWGNSVMAAGVTVGSNATTQYRYLVVKAKKSSTNPIVANLQTGVNNAPNIGVNSSNAFTVGSWTTFVFDFGSYNGTYKLLYLMPENGSPTTALTTYFDDMYFTNDVSTLVSAPAITGYTAWTPTAYGRAGNSISLFWNTLTTATTYNVYNGTTLLASGITTPYTTLTGLTSNTAYSIKITGVNGSGESLPSAALAVSTRAKVGVNYEIIDEIEGTNPGWTVMSNGTFTYGATNPVTNGINSSAKAIKMTFASGTNNYSGPQIVTERIVAGASANYRYFHVKILRPATAPATSGVKLKLTNGSLTLGQSSLTEQEIPLVTGTVVKYDGTWQDYVFDLKGAGVNDQIYKGFFLMPLNTTTGTVGVAGDCYLDDIYLSNDPTPLTTNINTAVVTLVSSDLSKGTVAGAGSYIKGVSATVTATPLSGYVFSKWNDGTTDVSTSASYTFTPSANITLTATFVTDPGTGLNQLSETNLVSVNGHAIQVNVAGEVQIYNSVGRLMISKKVVDAPVILNSTGVYLVKLVTSQGIKTQKIVVY